MKLPRSPNSSSVSDSRPAKRLNTSVQQSEQDSSVHATATQSGSDTEVQRDTLSRAGEGEPERSAFDQAFDVMERMLRDASSHDVCGHTATTLLQLIPQATTLADIDRVIKSMSPEVLQAKPSLLLVLAQQLLRACSNHFDPRFWGALSFCMASAFAVSHAEKVFSTFLVEAQFLDVEASAGVLQTIGGIVEDLGTQNLLFFQSELQAAQTVLHQRAAAARFVEKANTSQPPEVDAAAPDVPAKSGDSAQVEQGNIFMRADIVRFIVALLKSAAQYQGDADPTTVAAENLAAGKAHLPVALVSRHCHSALASSLLLALKSYIAAQINGRPTRWLSDLSLVRQTTTMVSVSNLPDIFKLAFDLRLNPRRMRTLLPAILAMNSRKIALALLTVILAQTKSLLSAHGTTLTLDKPDLAFLCNLPGRILALAYRLWSPMEAEFEELVEHVIDTVVEGPPSEQVEVLFDLMLLFPQDADRVARLQERLQEDYPEGLQEIDSWLTLMRHGRMNLDDPSSSTVLSFVLDALEDAPSLLRPGWILVLSQFGQGLQALSPERTVQVVERMLAEAAKDKPFRASFLFELFPIDALKIAFRAVFPVVQTQVRLLLGCELTAHVYHLAVQALESGAATYEDRRALLRFVVHTENPTQRKRLISRYVYRDDTPGHEFDFSEQFRLELLEVMIQHTTDPEELGRLHDIRESLSVAADIQKRAAAYFTRRLQ